MGPFSGLNNDPNNDLTQHPPLKELLVGAVAVNLFNSSSTRPCSPRGAGSMFFLVNLKEIMNDLSFCTTLSVTNLSE